MQTKDIITTREEIDSMRIGDTLVYPMERRYSIKTYCSDRGRMLCRKYAFRTDWKNRVVIVKRES